MDVLSEINFIYLSIYLSITNLQLLPTMSGTQQKVFGFSPPTVVNIADVEVVDHAGVVVEQALGEVRVDGCGVEQTDV